MSVSTEWKLGWCVRCIKICLCSDMLAAIERKTPATEFSHSPEIDNSKSIYLRKVHIANLNLDLLALIMWTNEMLKCPVTYRAQLRLGTERGPCEQLRADCCTPSVDCPLCSLEELCLECPHRFDRCLYSHLQNKTNFSLRLAINVNSIAKYISKFSRKQNLHWSFKIVSLVFFLFYKSNVLFFFSFIHLVQHIGIFNAHWVI